MPQYKYLLIFLLTYSSICQCKKNCTVIPEECPNTNYRSFDGSCNNLQHPEWGTPLTRFHRLLPADYGDGISSYRRTKSGKELPNARKISEIMYPEKEDLDKSYTLSLMQYGQIISHDLALSYADENINSCCTEDLQYLEKLPSTKCSPIDIPEDDSYYSKVGAKCISFARILTDADHGCGEDDKPVDQLTTVNSYLDLSIIYGNKKTINRYMRLNKNGLLRIRNEKGQDWPLKSLNTSRDCPLSTEYDTCYYTSDFGINQNPQLTLLHIIFYREHNRLATELSSINPHWDDDTVFEEARKINIAQHQWISYYEWLPLLLNRYSLLAYRVIHECDGDYVDDYDPLVDPSVLSEHLYGAYRLHMQIAGYLDLVHENRSWNDALRISDWYFQPRVLEEENYFTLLARGLTTQRCLASNRYHDHEITHYWFRRGNLGFDLKAIDIERSRDAGIPTYNKIRKLCNLPVAKTFDEITDIPKYLVQKLSELYETPEDLDMVVAGSLERLVPGALVGPTFHCIIMEQFKRTRIADRFWFERSGDTGFTLEQLNEIRAKTSLSRLMCDNTKDLLLMQPRAFEKIDITNPLVPCNSLPALDLSLWEADYYNIIY